MDICQSSLSRKLELGVKKEYASKPLSRVCQHLLLIAAHVSWYLECTSKIQVVQKKPFVTNEFYSYLASIPGGVPRLTLATDPAEDWQIYFKVE